MSIQQRQIVLTGARKGMTGELGQFQVVEGVIKLQGGDEDLLGWTRYIEMMWQGYPMGDPRIEEAQAAIDAANQESSDGKRDVQAGSVQSDGKSDLQGLAQHVGGQPSAGDGAPVGGQPSGASAGTADAAGALGNGQQAQLSENGKKPDPEVPTDERLKKALGLLDPAINEHWTMAGQPAIAAVEQFYGSGNVTRADIEAIAPGWRRPKTPSA